MPSISKSKIFASRICELLGFQDLARIHVISNSIFLSCIVDYKKILLEKLRHSKRYVIGLTTKDNFENEEGIEKPWIMYYVTNKDIKLRQRTPQSISSVCSLYSV